jgi:hypothetical protein
VIQGCAIMRVRAVAVTLGRRGGKLFP